MIRVGVVGTGPISKQFIYALRQTNKYEIRAIYSRTAQTAQQFATEESIPEWYDSWQDFLASDTDVVYVASPNSVHFAQTKDLLLQKKHVIVEKPAFSTVKEWQEIHALAKEQDCFVFEAARHIHETNFQIVQKWIEQHQNELDGAILNYAKYSSKYDAYLAGKEPNIFSPRYSGGALMDLGVYLVYAAVAWFGKPNQATYTARKLANGVDAYGTIIFQYEKFDVCLHVGKTFNVQLKSEVYAGKQTLQLDRIEFISSIEQFEERVLQQHLAQERQPHTLIDEAIAFARVIKQPTSEHMLSLYQYWTTLSLDVAQLLEQLRKDAGIYFSVDSNIE